MFMNKSLVWVFYVNLYYHIIYYNIFKNGPVYRVNPYAKITLGIRTENCKIDNNNINLFNIISGNTTVNDINVNIELTVNPVSCN